MVREELKAASDVLAQAVDDVSDSDARERLREQADQLDHLASRDTGPDHGRLDRHQQALRNIKAERPETADRIDEANDHITAYRETIEGV